jgi:hypothetical protein
MRTLACLLLVTAVLLSNEKANAQSSYDLRSPDNRIEVRIRTVGQIRYDVVVQTMPILENSTVSLDIDQ